MIESRILEREVSGGGWEGVVVPHGTRGGIRTGGGNEGQQQIVVDVFKDGVNPKETEANSTNAQKGSEGMEEGLRDDPQRQQSGRKGGGHPSQSGCCQSRRERGPDCRCRV